MNGKVGWITAVLGLLILILAACTGNQREPAAAPEPIEEVKEKNSSGVQIIASGTIVPPTARPPTATPTIAELPDLGEAPEILNETWLNTAEPMTLESVRGKVVLLEFWTFG